MVEQEVPMTETRAHVALIGAGPIGIEIAAALKRSRIPCVHFEKHQIAHTISWFPAQMQFFSSIDRIAVAGVPIPYIDRSRCTREEYLAYLRSVVRQFDLSIRTFEPVERIVKTAKGFDIHSILAEGECVTRVHKVILATGDTSRPNLLDIPGEDMTHVSHYLGDVHNYFDRRIVVVGGRNSAVEAALRCFRVGARSVTLSYRRGAFDRQRVKYWILPELEGLIERKEIEFLPRTVPVSISPGTVTLRSLDTDRMWDIPADAVLLMTGYRADMRLLRESGVHLYPPNDTPAFDETTMETNVPGLYVAGTAIAGTQESTYTVFIENCHIHAERIVASLLRKEAPEEPAMRKDVET